MREVSFGGRAKRIFGNVILSRIINNYGDSAVVHLTQEVKSIYPKKIMDTGFGPGLYDTTINSFDTTRNCLVKVPNGLTEDEIKERIQLFDSHIYVLISNNIQDILTADDLYRLETYNIQLYELEDKYETKDKEGNTYSKGLMRMTWDGEILRDLPKEYRRYIYSREYTEDIDLREKLEIKDIINTDKISYKLTI